VGSSTHGRARRQKKPPSYLSAARQEPSPTSGNLTSSNAILSTRTRKFGPERTLYITHANGFFTHPTSPRSTGFCAIWDCISSSSSFLRVPGRVLEAFSARFGVGGARSLSSLQVHSPASWRCLPRREGWWPVALLTSGGLGRYRAAQWHLARAVGKRFQGYRAKRLFVKFIGFSLRVHLLALLLQAPVDGPYGGEKRKEKITFKMWRLGQYALLINVVAVTNHPHALHIAHGACPSTPLCSVCSPPFLYVTGRLQVPASSMQTHLPVVVRL